MVSGACSPGSRALCAILAAGLGLPQAHPRQRRIDPPKRRTDSQAAPAPPSPETRRAYAHVDRTALLQIAPSRCQREEARPTLRRQRNLRKVAASPSPHRHGRLRNDQVSPPPGTTRRTENIGATGSHRVGERVRPLLPLGPSAGSGLRLRLVPHWTPLPRERIVGKPSPPRRPQCPRRQNHLDRLSQVPSRYTSRAATPSSLTA